MTVRVIDLNADLGEFAERLADGSDAELMRYVTSANVACGGHAGNALTMEQTMELARQHHVAVGAHPSYPDRAGFGRVSLAMAVPALQDSIAEQIHGLLVVARRMQIPLVHVKPHGALYHSCNRQAEIALSFARAVLSIDRHLIVLGQAGSPCLNIYRQMKLRTAAEAFADRAYEPDGSLRNRTVSGAVLDSPDRAAAQAVAIATRGRVTATSGSELSMSADTLCIHSDTPDSAIIARTVKEQLRQAGVTIRAIGDLARK
jgi:UPF0271 protein